MKRSDDLSRRRRSTVSFTQEARRTPGFSLFDWLHAQVYARWPYLYIGIGTGEHRLAKTYRRLAAIFSRSAREKDAAGVAAANQAFADTYHGKVVTLEAATQLVTVEQDVELRDLEHVVPYRIARDIVLRDPDHIVVLDCPCRASRPNPCLPLDVCLVVGEPFATFIAEHQPRRTRWIDAPEAIEILRAEHERGHVHHAFFKDAMLGRFYAICNCCGCCCGALQATRNGVPMLASSGYVSQVDGAACVGCGDCEAACPFGAISNEDGIASIDSGACMGCGVCVDRCSQGALSLIRDDAKPAPLEIDALMAAASGLPVKKAGRFEGRGSKS